MCYTCTAINSESAICSISSEKESTKNVNTDNFIVLKGHKMFSRDNIYFLKVCEDTKVCHILFLIIYLSLYVNFLQCHSVLLYMISCPYFSLIFFSFLPLFCA